MSLTTRPKSGDSGIRTGASIRSGGAYTPPDSVKIGRFLTSEIVSSTETLISIDKYSIPDHATAGAYLELTLTCNSQGAPVTNLDGLMLGRFDNVAVSGWQTYRHQSLRPGYWMHYGLFARYNVGGVMEWSRIATTEELLPEQHGYGERMFNRMPLWYQQQDDESYEHVARRLFQGVGNEIDITRTWIEQLGHTYDSHRIPARLLEPLSELLGLPYERTVGDPRVRKLLSNLIHLRKTKGTRESVEGYIKALSGFRTLVHQGPNIMTNVEDAEFLVGVGSWYAGPSCSVARSLVDVAGAPHQNSPGRGVLTVTRLSSSGDCRAISGVNGVTNMFECVPGVGRQLQVSTNARTLGGSMNLFLRFNCYDSSGTFVNSVDSLGLGITTTFDRVRSGWLDIDDTVRYVGVRTNVSGVAADGGYQFGEVHVSDRRYRPTGVPGYVNSEPFSEAGSTTYLGYDFYDSARASWINVYPQRTNFAVNSDFTLDDLPAGGWSVAEAATYGSMPFAYATYAAVAGAETDYADVADGYNSITPTWTINFDTVNERLEMVSSTSAPWIAQVRSKRFPVIPGISYSAAVEMKGDVDNGTASLRMQWFKLDDPNTPLDEESTYEGSQFDLNDVEDVRVTMINAVAPAGAGWARLVIESANTVEHTAYVRLALIEDTPKPGSYFNGDVADGAPGDFGYIGTAKQSFSVYYLNFDAVAGSGSNRILSASESILPIHSPNPRVTTAYNGLYDDLA